VASAAERIVEMRDGRIVGELPEDREEPVAEARSA
jgi:hypothetical protein